jgi:hypothetical protein
MEPNKSPSPCRMTSLPKKRIKNPSENSERSVIVYGVSLWFELENLEDFLIQKEFACYRRFTKKSTSQETETMDLKFYTIEDATKYIQAREIYVANQEFCTASKIVVPLKICRVCKKINLKHRPGSCTNIQRGKNTLNIMLPRTILKWHLREL